MPRKVTKRQAPVETKIVDFSFDDRTYQIDAARSKVYRRFVEIETAKAFEILSTWRAENVQV